MQAEFVERTRCINCGGSSLFELAGGCFSDEPLHGFINADPWGVNPMQYLKDSRWTFVQCQDCAQAFHKDILNGNWNARRFEEWMSVGAIIEFERRLGSPSGRRFEASKQHVAHFLRLNKLTQPLRSDAMRILDFGCGWGNFLSICNQMGADAVGVDRSQARRAGSVFPIHAELTDVQGQFHAITLFEVMEHLDAPASILKMLNPLLVEGGILVLETPDCLGISGIKSKDDYRKIHPLEHINAFTHATLKSIAERSGFQRIDQGPAHVTTDIGRVLKTHMKRVLKKESRSTQLYFEKVS